MEKEIVNQIQEAQRVSYQSPVLSLSASAALDALARVGAEETSGEGSLWSRDDFHPRGGRAGLGEGWILPQALQRLLGLPWWLRW